MVQKSSRRRPAAARLVLPTTLRSHMSSRHPEIGNDLKIPAAAENSWQ
jgi:hypothetical protein